MKLTLTEGLGLIAAAFVGTICTIAAHGGPPPTAPDDTARRALQRLAASVASLPEDPEGRNGYTDKTSALLNVARAQLKLGDRAAFFATLRILEGPDDPPPAQREAKSGLRSSPRCMALIEVAQMRRREGDLDGARATLARAARDLDALDCRGAVDGMGNAADTDMANKIGEPRDLKEQEAIFIVSASVALIEECIAQDEFALARTRIRHLLDAVGPAQGPMKTVLIGFLGSCLVRAGDPDEGRAVMKRAQQAAIALSDPVARAFAVQAIVRPLTMAGGLMMSGTTRSTPLQAIVRPLTMADEIDQALALVREVTPQAQERALEGILGELTVIDPNFPGGAMADLTSGINIMIGKPWLSLKDPAAARTALPKIAAAARASLDVKVQARTLACIARLQAPGRRCSGRPGHGQVHPRPETVGLPRTERRLLRCRETRSHCPRRRGHGPIGRPVRGPRNALRGRGPRSWHQARRSKTDRPDSDRPEVRRVRRAGGRSCCGQRGSPSCPRPE